MRLMGVRWSHITSTRWSPRFFKPLQKRPHHFGVEVLDGLEFQLQFTLVAGFVRGLHVDKDQVLLLQGRQGRVHLALVIGVEVAGGPGDQDGGEAGV